jgi:hypothetical protein
MRNKCYMLLKECFFQQRLKSSRSFSKLNWPTGLNLTILSVSIDLFRFLPKILQTNNLLKLYSVVIGKVCYFQHPVLFNLNKSRFVIRQFLILFQETNINRFDTNFTYLRKLLHTTTIPGVWHFNCKTSICWQVGSTV